MCSENTWYFCHVLHTLRPKKARYFKLKYCRCFLNISYCFVHLSLVFWWSHWWTDWLGAWCQMDDDHPDSMVHGTNMGPIWGRQDPGGPHVGCMNFAIWAETNIIYFPIIHYCLRQQTGQNQWNQYVADLLHICVHKITIIGPDNNGLSLGQHQAIIWSNAGILLIQTIGTNFTEILSEIHTFSFKKMHLKMS